ncbi:MAG: non-lysosomal glucosylceramidase [Abditibacteriales bacterium]|nr:non-lysosomal glucosylceramidase [Abditibacteriales bacterium]MDW8366287.1 GH116 family glycosyl-hydrolase [Abditibacteriales bacterium]
MSDEGATHCILSISSAIPPNAMKVYSGEHLRCVALPLGGIGTGTISICGDGSLRQWEIVNQVNHQGYVPQSFFAVRVQPPRGRAVAKVLQMPPLPPLSSPPCQGGEGGGAASVSDHLVPDELRELMDDLPGVEAVEFVGEYPIAQLTYKDDALPVAVKCECFSPFVPLNEKDSGLPAIVFIFSAHNPTEQTLSVSFLATLQNFVGWDNVSLIRENENFGYGGNRNTVLSLNGWTAIEMRNDRLPHDAPTYGTVCLATLNAGATFIAEWEELESLWDDFVHDGRLSDAASGQPSPTWETWNGALCVPLTVEPHTTQDAKFLLCWHFPNRYVNWTQPGGIIKDQKSKFYLGNAYNNHFGSALAVAEYVRDHFDRLVGDTRKFRETFYDSTLPSPLLDAVTSQASIIRTPTGMWVEDGTFHAFEGCHGASTGGADRVGGCCPLNCTHVWNYEMSLAALFPALERTMRRTDLLVQMREDGSIPHRTIVPEYLPRLWGDIGGPRHHALDGMLGAVLKTYREFRKCGDVAWLANLAPSLRKLMDYIMRTFDAQGDGVIRGEQPNTYDIHTYGSNTFIGTLYLAALRAMEEMAKIVARDGAADPNVYRERFEQGRVNYDRLCWNGEYFINNFDAPGEPPETYNQRNCWGPGCHADQLLGQWWAHELDLGYLLPEAHVKSALQAIMRYNFRENFIGFKQDPRQFASEHDRGLLICTWPHGGRPESPILYCDEVWTGIEYEVAALLLWEGFVEDALKIVQAVRDRYDGRERNPWNEVECGDHYARAMSSWTLLTAASGFRYNAHAASIAFAPRLVAQNEFKSFFIAADGWGTFAQRTTTRQQTATLEVKHGTLTLKQLTLQRARKSRQATEVAATVAGRKTAVKVKVEGNDVTIEFRRPVTAREGERIDVSM